MTPTWMSRNPCLPRQLAEYESWCNARSFDTAASLVHDELLRVFPFGLKTLHHTLFHTLDVFRHGSAFLAPQQVDVGWRAYDPTRSIDDLRRECDHLSQAFLTLIDDAHRADLLHQDRRLVQVFHLVTHGTHHRTQFITMLRLLGKDAPFEAGDFAGWQRQRP